MTIDKHSFDRLIADREEMITLLSSYGLNHNGVTPYGLLDRVNKHFSTDNNSTLHYNSYYTNSLLRNGNKWIDLDSLKDLVPFNLS